jgi:hypothetical protein
MNCKDDKIHILPTLDGENMHTFVEDRIARLGHRIDVVKSLRSEAKSTWALQYWAHVEKQLMKKLTNIMH